MKTALELAHEARRAKREAGEAIIRLDPLQKAAAHPNSLRAAINGKCWDCSGGQRVEIRDCTITKCTLHNVRPYQQNTDEE